MIERVIPVLVYEDIPAAHDFLVDAFGFTSGGVYRDAEGRKWIGTGRGTDARRRDFFQQQGHPIHRACSRRRDRRRRENCWERP